jgi:sulfate-transporting ATPase
VVLSYVDQHRDALDDEKTVFEEITDGKDRIELGNVSVNSAGLRGAVQLPRRLAAEAGGRVLRRRAEPHPPGQDAPPRRQPAACWTSRPTIWTWPRCGVLEQALIDFPGCALVISHDRFFLDRICTHLLVMEGNGRPAGSRAILPPMRSR